jgi:NADH-quinone oxidoreductase subunit C/D
LVGIIFSLKKIMELIDKIKAIAPEAVCSETGEPVITLKVDDFRRVAEMLRADKEAPMDYLRDIVGMDWGEKGLGALYYLESSQTYERVALKISTLDRENAFLPSVCDLWKTAEIKEREVFDFFGIRFLNNPDMRRLFLREDWKGYPLRKDYDMNSNPLNMENEENADVTDEYFLKPDGTICGRKNIVFDQKDFVVNIGPQHPSTHGVLRLRTSLEGETISKVDPICGYIHRGIEKMNESLTYPQTLALTDRLDYLSAHQNRHALCMCIEQAMGLEIPERVQYIRTIMDELQRIDSHLLFYSCLVMDMGGLTPFFYGFREREMILDIFEETTGGRLIQNYNVIGGVQADLHPDFQKKVKEFIVHLRSVIKDYHDIFTGNVIATTRLKGVGLLSKEDAISLGATGGTGRASGWANDVRKHHPYAMYDKVDFKEILYTEGDSFARYMVRMDEIMESCHIIEQLIDNIPEGEFRVKTKPIIKLPEGNYSASVETSRGEFDVFLESHGDKSPYRLHYRSTGLPLVHALDTVCRGNKIADLIAIGGTLDYVIPDIDR